MMEELRNISIIESYIAQAIGFVLIFFAWLRAFTLFVRIRRFYRTRLLMFVITSVALVAYLFPTFAAICYFVPGCFKPWYRDVLRAFSGNILFLYGLFKFLYLYTKDDDTGGVVT